MVSSVEISGVGPSPKSCMLPIGIDRSCRLDSDVCSDVSQKVVRKGELVSRKAKCVLSVGGL